MNPLKQLQNHDQSFWLDYMRRSLMTSGELKKMVEDDGLRGMTSNPTIFEKAISAGSEYDADLKRFAAQGKTNNEIFEELAVADIQKACDVLKPVYVSSGGADGFISLEVNPELAYDTEATLSEAKRLFKRVKRPNLMIKIPATPDGLPAIEEALAAGVNVNITLIFSVEDYKRVLDAFVKALERRVRKGLPVKNIASVASFFVSRVDTIIDKQLDRIIAEGGPKKAEAERLLHKAGVGNAKVAYAHLDGVMKSPRFEKLRRKGAQVQRLLWASTGAKDKRLPDVHYINELIGPHTVNTMPPQTAEAFRDHGRVAPRLLEGWEQAQADLNALASLGVDFEKSMRALQQDGVKLFIDSNTALMRGVEEKAELLTGRNLKKTVFTLGEHQGKFEAALKRIEQEKWVERAWKKEAALWKSDAEHQKIIGNSLGWLTVMDHVRRNMDQIQSIVRDVRKAGFTHALLLGMGGSSLCPEVLRLTFGKKPGYLDLAILDSTEPASVLERAQRSKPEKTLYIVASKSGSTAEPNAFLAYFYDQVRRKKGDKAGDHFIAITDPGTSMERLARDKNFRHVVLNPPDIGGRYSALSFFGMLPAALMGVNVLDLLAAASRLAGACSPAVPASKNTAARLGAALGVLANEGRDKVTFILSKEIASFSTWVEQLIAESTGKEGKGILPVESEDIQPPAFYGKDRVFVSIRTASDRDKSALKKLDALKRARHPVIQIAIDGKADLGSEFFRWEFATAIAGAVMGINPFDQPNVQESKDLTKWFIEQYKREGRLPQDAPTAQEDGVKIYASNGAGQASSLEELLRNVIDKVGPQDYVALLAYVERNPKHEQLLRDIRKNILAAKKVATTVGFGPRFLHSTGQLHKGGANNGVFLQITADDKKDLPIPGEPYTYSVLKEAQALGDLSALKNKQRRAVRIHLADADRGLARLKQAISRVVKS